MVAGWEAAIAAGLEDWVASNRSEGGGDNGDVFSGQAS